MIDNKVSVQYRIGKLTNAGVVWLTETRENLITQSGMRFLKKYWFADMTKNVFLGTGGGMISTKIQAASVYPVSGSNQELYNISIQTEIENPSGKQVLTNEQVSFTIDKLEYIDNEYYVYSATINETDTIPRAYNTPIIIQHVEYDRLTAPVMHSSRVIESEIRNYKSNSDTATTIGNKRVIVFDPVTNPTLSVTEIGWSPEFYDLTTTDLFGMTNVDVEFQQAEVPYIEVAIIRTIDCNSYVATGYFDNVIANITIPNDVDVKLLVNDDRFDDKFYSTIDTDGSTKAPVVLPTIFENKITKYDSTMGLTLMEAETGTHFTELADINNDIETNSPFVLGDGDPTQTVAIYSLSQNHATISTPWIVMLFSKGSDIVNLCKRNVYHEFVEDSKNTTTFSDMHTILVGFTFSKVVSIGRIELVIELFNSTSNVYKRVRLSCDGISTDGNSSNQDNVYVFSVIDASGTSVTGDEFRLITGSYDISKPDEIQTMNNNSSDFYAVVGDSDIVYYDSALAEQHISNPLANVTSNPYVITSVKLLSKSLLAMGTDDAKLYILSSGSGTEFNQVRSSLDLDSQALEIIYATTGTESYFNGGYLLVITATSTYHIHVHPTTQSLTIINVLPSTIDPAQRRVYLEAPLDKDLMEDYDNKSDKEVRAYVDHINPETGESIRVSTTSNIMTIGPKYPRGTTMRLYQPYAAYNVVDGYCFYTNAEGVVEVANIEVARKNFVTRSSTTKLYGTVNKAAADYVWGRQNWRTYGWGNGSNATVEILPEIMPGLYNYNRNQTFNLTGGYWYVNMEFVTYINNTLKAVDSVSVPDTHSIYNEYSIKLPITTYSLSSTELRYSEVFNNYMFITFGNVLTMLNLNWNTPYDQDGNYVSNSHIEAPGNNIADVDTGLHFIIGLYWHQSDNMVTVVGYDDTGVLTAKLFTATSSLTELGTPVSHDTRIIEHADWSVNEDGWVSTQPDTTLTPATTYTDGATANVDCLKINTISATMDCYFSKTFTNLEIGSVMVLEFDHVVDAALDGTNVNRSYFRITGATNDGRSVHGNASTRLNHDLGTEITWKTHREVFRVTATSVTVNFHAEYQNNTTSMYLGNFSLIKTPLIEYVKPGALVQKNIHTSIAQSARLLFLDINNQQLSITNYDMYSIVDGLDNYSIEANLSYSGIAIQHIQVDPVTDGYAILADLNCDDGSSIALRRFTMRHIGGTLYVDAVNAVTGPGLYGVYNSSAAGTSSFINEGRYLQMKYKDGWAIDPPLELPQATFDAVSGELIALKTVKGSEVIVHYTGNSLEIDKYYNFTLHPEMYLTNVHSKSARTTLSYAFHPIISDSRSNYGRDYTYLTVNLSTGNNTKRVIEGNSLIVGWNRSI